MKRNITIIFIVVLIGSVSIAVVRLGLRSRAQGPGPPYVPLDNRLQWYAQQAKATAKDEIEIPSPNVDYGGSSPTTTLDSALSAYTVVLAEPIQEITIAAGNEIVTWYRFKTLEILISHESPACPGC